MAAPTPFDVDQVLWDASLAADAYAVDRAERRVTHPVGLVLAVLLVVAVAVHLAGLWAPRLSIHGSNASLHNSLGSATAELNITLRNNSLVPTEVAGVADPGIPGLAVLAAATDAPIAPLSEGTLVMRLQVDCSRLPAIADTEPAPDTALSLIAQTWHGPTTVTVTDVGTLRSTAQEACSS